MIGLLTRLSMRTETIRGKVLPLASFVLSKTHMKKGMTRNVMEGGDRLIQAKYERFFGTRWLKNEPDEKRLRSRAKRSDPKHREA